MAFHPRSYASAPVASSEDLATTCRQKKLAMSVRSVRVSFGDIQVGVAVMIEVPEIRGPGPAAHFNAGLTADVLKRSISAITIESAASRMSLVEFADILRRLFVKLLLF